VALARF